MDYSYAFAQYKSIMAMDRTNERKYLESLRDDVDGELYFNGKRVCYRFLLYGFRFSNSLISSVKGTQKSNPAPGTTMRQKKRMTKGDSVRIFIDRYASATGDRMPNSDIKNIPVTKRKEVYENYKKYFAQNHEMEIQEPISTKSYFYRV